MNYHLFVEQLLTKYDNNNNPKNKQIISHIVLLF